MAAQPWRSPGDLHARSQQMQRRQSVDEETFTAHRFLPTDLISRTLTLPIIPLQLRDIHLFLRALLEAIML